MKTLRHIFLSILIWIFYVEAFEIRIGIKDYGYRIVFDGVKNYEYLPISNALIFKVVGEFKGSAIKLLTSLWGRNILPAPNKSPT